LRFFTPRKKWQKWLFRNTLLVTTSSKFAEREGLQSAFGKIERCWDF